mgnify:CR=1 FL=1
MSMEYRQFYLVFLWFVKDPSKVMTEGGIDPIMRGKKQIVLKLWIHIKLPKRFVTLWNDDTGLCSQAHQAVDVYNVGAIRNLLFGTTAGLDLIALDIFRARDHGLKFVFYLSFDTCRNWQLQRGSRGLWPSCSYFFQTDYHRRGGL